MHSATIFFALAAVASASAVGVVNDIVAYPAYKYSYGVADKLTGDQKSASEVRDGGVTKGSYSLVQPDGVIRTVNYISTPLGGFQAQVINKGVAGHPAVYSVGKGIGSGLGGGLIGVDFKVGLIGGGLGARSVVGGLRLGLGGIRGDIGLIGGGGLGAGIIG
ncbi:Cuticle protein 21 [Orchesella cincta]|uniref:Cuticle protein 21 n=1 Tax=Orchesella cincta TaxID=48709 RepID=A0A1D2MJF4_ORCCI|nr:Cuticle protein 21 [Orchesella cincta]